MHAFREDREKDSRPSRNCDLPVQDQNEYNPVIIQSEAAAEMPYPSGARPLDTGDPFPSLSITAVDGSTLTLPKPGRWVLFAVYRGDF